MENFWLRLVVVTVIKPLQINEILALDNPERFDIPLNEPNENMLSWVNTKKSWQISYANIFFKEGKL